MRQINLLPRDIAQKRRARQITVFLAVAGLGLVAILGLVLVIQQARLSGERSRLRDARASNAQLQQRVNELQSFAELQQTIRTKEDLLSELSEDEVRWSLLLSNVSLVIPSDVWLTSLSGSVGPGQIGSIQTIGTIQFSGMTFTHIDVARWLTRLSAVEEFLFPYLSLSAKTEDAAQTLVQFNSSVGLSDEALRRNQPGGERRI